MCPAVGLVFNVFVCDSGLNMYCTVYADKVAKVREVKLSLLRNKASRQARALGEWRYRSTHFEPRNWMGVSA